MKSSPLKTLVSDIGELVQFLDELGGESVTIDNEILGNLNVRLDDVKASPINPSPSLVKSAGEIKPSAVVAPVTPTKDLSSILANTKLPSLSKITGAKDQVTKRVPESNSASDTRNPDEVNTMKKTKDLSVHTTLEEIKKEIGTCTRCGLCEERTQVVHSIGAPNARLMFIGEAPGADEDAKGEPFVGRAGQLLTRIIDAMGFQREDVFIGNINRCRPPGNRAPKIDEADQCRPFLLREIEIVKPEVIVVLGNTACQNLLNTKEGITKLRGNFQDYFGVKVMPTFHPAYLLRDPSKKKLVWDDMKQVMELLNEEGGSK
jgi:DNA polymerase